MTTGVFFVILFLCLLVALFCVFRFGRDDVILIRKNVSMEQLFNLAFLCGFVGVLIGWLGNSLIGGIAGGVIFLMFLTRRKKFPTGRIADIFSVAFLCAMPLGFVLLYVFQQQNEIASIVSVVFSLFLLLFFVIILFPKAVRGDMKYGSLTFLFLINISLLALLTSVVRRMGKSNFSFSIEDGLVVVILLSTCFLLARQEKKLFLHLIKR